MPTMPVAKRKPAARRPGKPTAKPKAGKRPRLRLPMSIDVESWKAAERFEALPIEQRDQILAKGVAKLRRAFVGTTLDELLADMRKDDGDDS